MNTGMSNANMYHASPTVPSSYANGHPRKKRRANTMSSVNKPPHVVLPPLPTPTSATHPINSETKQPVSARSEASSNQAPSPATSLPSVLPSGNGSASGSQNNSASLNSAGLPFSPNFSFSPLPPIPSLAPTPTPGQTHAHPPPPQPSQQQTQQQQQDSSNTGFDPMLSMPTPYDHPTPGAASTSGGSVHTDHDKDPFLSLLEQLAENEVSRGGPSELDYFLSGQSG